MSNFFDSQVEIYNQNPIIYDVIDDDMKKYVEVDLSSSGIGIKDSNDNNLEPEIYLYDNEGVKQKTGINMNINNTTGKHEVNFIIKGQTKMIINDDGVTGNIQSDLPSQTGQQNKLLTTNGTTASWTNDLNINSIISQSNISSTTGNITADKFYAGNGTSTNPSFSFSTATGQDTGLSYDFSNGVDRLRLNTGGIIIAEFNANQVLNNSRVNCQLSTQSAIIPALNFHFNSTNTGYAGEQTNAATDPRLWAIVNGVQSTELTRTNFNIGLNTSNNTNMKTVNVNGPSNFNTYTPNYSLILTPTLSCTFDPTGTASQLLDIACNTSNGVYVICSNTTTAGHQRLFVSEPNNLTTWTAITDSVVNMSSINSVVFGNGVWACLRTGSQTRQYYYTTDITAKTGWTQVANVAPWSTSRNIQKLKFINNQFVCIDSGSRYRVSNDGINWSLEVTMASVSSACGDIKYSPQLRRYVCVTTLFQILYYDATSLPTTGTNVFTTVNMPNAALQSLEWSPKLGLFVTIATTAGQPFYISKDGINWISPGSLSWFTKEILWVNDYGGFFMASPQQATNNLAISRDGINWSFVPLSFTAIGNANYYNPITKMFVFSGTDIAHYRDVNTLFSSYVDTDLIYNTFNSNVRFDDIIEYKTQTITPLLNDSFFTISTFNKPIIRVDTTTADFNIYLQGQQYNNRIGTKFTIIKTMSSNNNIILRGYETCTIISELGYITSFNYQSNPNNYVVIPNNYYGSFDIIRVSDSNNGTWQISNINVYDGSGQKLDIKYFNYLSGQTIYNLNISTLILKSDNIIEQNTNGAANINIVLDVNLTRSVKFNVIMFGSDNTTVNNNNFDLINGTIVWGSSLNTYSTNFTNFTSSTRNFTWSEPGQIIVQFIYNYDPITPTNSRWIISRLMNEISEQILSRYIINVSSTYDITNLLINDNILFEKSATGNYTVTINNNYSTTKSFSKQFMLVNGFSGTYTLILTNFYGIISDLNSPTNLSTTTYSISLNTIEKFELSYFYNNGTNSVWIIKRV